MSERSDENIMLKVKEGDLNEMTFLFERYNKYLYNYFRKLGFDRENSRDFTQQVFYRILKYRESYSPDFFFKAWIFRIARNIVSRHIESQKLKFTDEQNDIVDNTIESTEYQDKQEQYTNLYRALDNLSHTDREIITLNRFQGLKYDEIAEVTQLSVSAIKVRVHRAMHKLREQFFKSIDY